MGIVDFWGAKIKSDSEVGLIFIYLFIFMTPTFPLLSPVIHQGSGFTEPLRA